MKLTRSMRRFNELVTAFQNGLHAQIAQQLDNPDLERLAFKYNPDGSVTLPKYLMRLVEFPDHATTAALWALATAALHQCALDQNTIAELEKQATEDTIRCNAFQVGLRVLQQASRYICATQLLGYSTLSGGAMLEFQLGNLHVTYIDDGNRIPRLAYRSNTTRSIGEGRLDIAPDGLTPQQINELDLANRNVSDEGYAANCLAYDGDPAMLAKIYPHKPGEPTKNWRETLATDTTSGIAPTGHPHANDTGGAKIIEFDNPFGTEVLAVDATTLAHCKGKSRDELVKLHPALKEVLSPYQPLGR